MKRFSLFLRKSGTGMQAAGPLNAVSGDLDATGHNEKAQAQQRPGNVAGARLHYIQTGLHMISSVGGIIKHPYAQAIITDALAPVEGIEVGFGFAKPSSPELGILARAADFFLKAGSKPGLDANRNTIRSVIEVFSII
jgi:hypothetical protein